MENYDTERIINEDDMLLPNESRFFLREAAKWAYFLSTVGFVFLGISAIMLIIGAFPISFSDSYPWNDTTGNVAVFRWLYVIICLIVLGIYFIPLYFLNRFSIITRRALDMGNPLNLAAGFRNLKNHYLFLGVLTIIMIAFIVINFIMTIMRFA